MPEVLEQHYRDRMQSVRELAIRAMKQFALSHDAGRAVRAGFVVEDLVALCSDLAEAGQQWLELEYKRIFREADVTVVWLLERRRAIEELCERFLEVAASVKGLLDLASQGEGTVPGRETAARLEQAVQRMATARQSVLERWPVRSEQEIAQARAGGSPEDYLDPDEAFAQAAGVDVETWRKRMEKYRQPRPN